MTHLKKRFSLWSNHILLTKVYQTYNSTCWIISRLQDTFLAKTMQVVYFKEYTDISLIYRQLKLKNSRTELLRSYDCFSVWQAWSACILPASVCFIRHSAVITAGYVDISLISGSNQQIPQGCRKFSDDCLNYVPAVSAYI